MDLESSQRQGRVAVTRQGYYSVRQVYWRLSAPFFGLLVFSFLSVVGLVVYVTKTQNSTELDRSLQLAKVSFANIDAIMKSTAVDLGFWDQAVDNLVTKLDPAWADDNVGVYVQNSQGIDATYVLGPENELVYSSIGGERVVDDPMRRFPSGLPQLIADVRSADPAEDPVPAVGYLVDGGTLFVASVIRLTSYTETENLPTDHMLIFTRKLGEQFFQEFGERFIMPNLRFELRDTTVDGARLPIATADGAQTGSLLWDANRPGTAALPYLLTGTVVIFALMMVFYILFVRRAQSVSEDIMEARQRMIESDASRELAQRTASFKSSFLTAMSHELRTPLNAILGFNQLLKMDLDEASSEDSRMGHLQIERSGNQLLALIEQILVLERIEMGKLSPDFRSVFIDDVVQECVDMIDASVAERSITVRWYKGQGPILPVQTDPDMLKQIVLNFFTNAVKYNVEGGTIEITTSTVLGGEVEIRVKDSGIGIPPEKHGQIFLPFERLGHEGSAIEGSGVGLSICEEMARMLGATVDFSSQVEEGSEFWVRLPSTRA